MTLKMEGHSDGRRTRIRLSGELRCEQLGDLRAEIERAGQRVILDLTEVDHVDVHAVRFLNACETQNIAVVNCASYIRQWMIQERRNDHNPEGT